MDPIPSQSKPEKTIFSLCDEVLLHIFYKLEMCDMVQLSKTCQRLQRILCDRTICQNLWIPWNIGTSRDSTITFIEQRSSIITSLTLTNITWIPSTLIQSIVLNLPLLKGLHVAGTRFNWAHLHEVLKSPLPILDKLSWTYDSELEKSIRNQIKKRTTETVQSNNIYDELLLLREKFQQFKYLLFHLNNRESNLTLHRSRYLRRNFYGISYIISLCTNIEEFWLIGILESFANNTLNELRKVDFSKLEFPNLHTLVITPMSNYFQDDLPEIINYLLDAFQKNNVRGDLKSTMKLWMAPSFLSRTVFRPGFSLSSLSWLKMTGILETYLDTNVDLSQLKKFDARGFRNRSQEFLEYAPNLESFTCPFETSVDWSQVAVNNLKLKEVTVFGKRDQKFAESCADIAKLPLLQKISLPLASITTPEIILQYNSDQELTETLRHEAEDGTMLRTPDGSLDASKENQQQRPPTGLDCVTLNCHNVKEFELGAYWRGNLPLDYENGDGVGFVNVDLTLSNISRWSHLEYLSLCYVPLIGDGEFLIKVAESCKLKSLRLVLLGRKNQEFCTYTACLYTALKLMPHLKDFEFQQNYIGSVTPLFQALQSCHKLQRLTVIVNENFSSAPLEASAPLELMNASRFIYMFYLFLSSASEESCEFLTRIIIEKFKSTRPALNVMIANTRIDIINRKEIFFNYVHHCDLMQCENESCFKLYDRY